MFRNKEYVMEVEKTKSFSKAAANLFVSQPSLSMTIKRLEDEIGEPLFDRSSYPIQLTECGKQYIIAANLIKTAENDFVSFLNDYKHLENGNLRIGGSNMSVSYFLPPLVEKFNSKYPDIIVTLVEGTIGFLEKELLDGRIDLLMDTTIIDAHRFDEYIYNRDNLIIMVPFNIKTDPETIPYRMTYEDVMNLKQTYDSVKPLPINYLNRIPFIFMNPGTDTYERATKLCEAYDYHPNIRMSFDQQSTTFHIACAGAGATIISDELLRNSQVAPKAFFYKIDPAIGSRFIKLFSKKKRPLNYMMRAFISIAEETGKVFKNDLYYQYNSDRN